MLNILAATVVTTALTSGAVRNDCVPQLVKLQTYADRYEGYVERPVTLYIVPASAAPEEKILAWTLPKMRTGEVWMREDFVCAASPLTLELILIHEYLHLKLPDLSHGEIELTLKAIVLDTTGHTLAERYRPLPMHVLWQMYREEIEGLIGERMEGWSLREATYRYYRVPRDEQRKTLRR